MAITGVLNGSIQTSWDTHPNQGVPGLLTYINEPHDYIACPIESDFIAFGSAVAKGTIITNRENAWGTTVSPYTLTAATAASTAANIVGILAYNAGGGVGPNPVMTGNEANIASGMFKYQMGTLVRLGCVHVKNYADTTEDAVAFMVINATNSVNAAIGDWVTTDLGGAAIAIPGARWYSSDLHSMNETSVLKVNFLFGVRS